MMIVAGVGIWLVHNAVVNLASRNVSSGFGFLKDTAGFAISEGLVPYEHSDSYARVFLAGFANTLRAAFPAVFFATALGFALGIAQISRHSLVRLFSRSFVDVVRNIPLLVQVLLWYFALTELLPNSESPLQFGPGVFLSKAGAAFPAPQMSVSMTLAVLTLTLFLPWSAWKLRRRCWAAVPVSWIAVAGMWLLLPQDWHTPKLGIFGVTGGIALSPEWLAIVLALSQYSGVYCAEIVRAGLQAVPRGQWEVSNALGLTRGQTLRRVIIPQGLCVIVPPYTSLVMNTIKNSSLAVAVGYPDIVSVATTTLNQNGQAIECIATVAGVYLMLNLLTASVMALVNARVQFKER